MLDLGCRGKKTLGIPLLMFGLPLIKAKCCMLDRLDESLEGISGRLYYVQSWSSSAVKFGMICCRITDFIRKNLIFLSDAPIDKLLCYTQFEEMVWSNPHDDQSSLHLCQIQYVFAQPMERNEKKWHDTYAVLFWELWHLGKYLFAVLFSLFQGQNVKCCIAIS